MREALLKLMNTKGDLPPFPDIVVNLQKQLKNPYVGINDIAEIIKLDMALSGRILKIASSAYYTTGVEDVKTLPVAINKIGMDKIKQLVLSLELTKLFTNSKVLDHFSFWRHCLAVAIVTQKLSTYTEVSEQVRDMAYLSGLMHDVGIMVFAYLIPDEYSEFLQTIGEEEETLEKQEAKRFGIDHQELGALFIKKWWEVDPEIILAVEFHHFPFKGTENEKRSIQLVNVANGICNSQGLTNGINCHSEVFKEGAWEQLGLELTDVENIVKDVTVAMDQTMELLGKGSK